MLEQENKLQERRRHSRTHIQMRLDCIRLDPDGEDIVDSLQTLNISSSGIGAIAQHRFYPGQRVLLCLPLTSIGGHRNVYASVVRCRQERDGYNVGLKFDSISGVTLRNPLPATAAAA